MQRVTVHFGHWSADLAVAGDRLCCSQSGARYRRSHIVVDFSASKHSMPISSGPRKLWHRYVARMSACKMCFSSLNIAAQKPREDHMAAFQHDDWLQLFG